MSKHLDVRTALDLLGANPGSVLGAPIPNPIPEGYAVQWGVERLGGSWQWTLVTSDSLQLSGVAFSGATPAAGAETSELIVSTGEVTNSGAGTMASGGVAFRTGDVSTTAAGGTGTSGALSLSTGRVNASGGGLGGDSGVFTISTGIVALGDSGALQLTSGAAGVGSSGPVNLEPGPASAGNAIGQVQLGALATVGVAEPPVLVRPRTSINLEVGFRDRYTLGHTFGRAYAISPAPSTYPDDPEWTVVSGSANAPTLGITPEGLSAISTSAVSIGDQAVLVPNGAFPTPWAVPGLVAIAGAPRLHWQIKTPVDISAQRIESGWRTTPTAFDLTTDPDFAFFFYDAALSPNWHLATRAGGVAAVVTDTTIPVLANTFYPLHLSVDASGNVSGFVGDVMIADGTTHTMAAAPGVAYAGTESQAAAAQSLQLAGVGFSVAVP